MTADNATALLRAIATSQDEQAFTELFSNYAPRIKSYMLRQGAEASLAEELAQEALTTVWRKASLYSPEKGSATTWIFTIARNLRIDRLRRERAWQELPQEHEEQPSNDTPPDENVSLNERAAAVNEALNSLPSDQYEVVTLSFIEGLSHSEIAERLSVPLGTVKSRMRLAYAKLKPQVSNLE
ncbi:MAG: sigma-70 family RNA polymerase sigma factor [Pseudomonadota bacterium]